MSSLKRLVCVLLWTVASTTGRAEIPSGYVSVAQREDVPADLLYALACAESGRRLSDGQIRPWPWALNVAGDSRFYPTRAAAYHDLTRELSKQFNVDIGLGQISWYWHQRRLISPWVALDPYFNLTLAARLLRTEFDHCDCNDWWTAVERYHAPSDSENADRRRARYRASVERCWRQE